MAIVSAKEVIGIGSQTTARTVTSEFNAIPVDAGSFSASETFEQILDNGRRGSEAMDYMAYQGVGATEISFDFPMMFGAATGANNTGSILGILLRNILGTGAPGATSSAGSASSTEQRASARTEIAYSSGTAFNTWFRLGGEQEYLTIARNLIGGTGDAHWLDCRVSELTISANAGEGPVTVSASLTGQPATVGSGSTIVTTKTLSDQIALGFQNSCEASATTYQPYLLGTKLYHATDANVLNRMISFEVTLSREASPIYTLSNTRNFNDLYLGPLEVTWSAVAEINNTELDLMRGGTNPIAIDGTKKTQVAFSSGTVNTVNEKSLLISMPVSSPFESPLELDTSGAYSTVSIGGRALTGNAVMPISGDDYDNNDVTKRSPIEFQITEPGHATGTAPTYV
tara:strand:- start:586 stop:1785 length:1200 start_codon:yes stop_codon:yes gene_type:complete